MHHPYGITNIDTSTGNYNLGMVAYGDALVVPKLSPGIRRGAAVGVFDASGRYIRESGLERHWGRVTHAPELNPDAQFDHVEGAAIFGGYIVNHFGHFTLETLSRLWALKDRDLPIVWGSRTELLPWQREILAHVGIDPARHVFVNGPTVFSRLWVPTPGYIIGRWFHDEQQAALKAPTTPPGRARIYLSRSSFRSKIANIAGEAALEERLTQAGWQVIHPETLSFDEQLAHLTAASHIAGIEGSAFHTLMFCANPDVPVMVLRREKGNSNFDTIAAAMGIRQISLEGEISKLPGEDNAAYSLDDPHRAAARILDYSP